MNLCYHFITKQHCDKRGKWAELPVASEATNPIIGSAAYAPENDALVWKIKYFPGGKVRDVTSLSGLIGGAIKSSFHLNFFFFMILCYMWEYMCRAECRNDSWSSSSREEGFYTCEVWDPIFHYLWDTGVLVFQSLYIKLPYEPVVDESIILVAQVRYLKSIIKSGYLAFPWARRITVAGDYERRLI